MQNAIMLRRLFGCQEDERKDSLCCGLDDKKPDDDSAGEELGEEFEEEVPTCACAIVLEKAVVFRDPDTGGDEAGDHEEAAED